jgi:hypothetical protein
MKKIVLYGLTASLIAAFVFSGCEKNDEYKLDPNRLLPLKIIDNNPTVEGAQATKQKRLSAHEFCCNALNMQEYACGVIEIDIPNNSAGSEWGGHAFSDEQIDTTNNIVCHWACFIIGEDGSLLKEYLNSKDIYYRSDITGDTVAYISNNAIRSARSKIDSLFNAEKYEEVYKVYQDAMTIYTCTGAEFKALKGKGLN